MTDPTPADVAPEAAPPPQPIEPHDLNVALIKAIGLDDDKIGGFRLEVCGGTFPMLQVWFVPPSDGETLTDDWVAPLHSAAADATYVMLPGGNAEAPPVQLRPGLPGFPPDDLAGALDAMADILNGASCTPDLREVLTNAARRYATDARRLGRTDIPMIAAADVARMLRGTYSADNLNVIEGLHAAGLDAGLARSVEVATREVGT